ncbi:MAG TPA: hypothetical protein VFU21_29755 [Kofleriaceae bacterium]|nr:hypothetical protein [Kofleriaceae bacterium]
MRRAPAGIAAAGLLAALAGPAAGQDKARKPAGQVELGGGPDKPVGAYSGVEPGQEAPPGHRPRRGKYPLLTWVGFQPHEGGSSRVFIQLDRDVTHHESVKNGALVVTLEKARYANTNARRFLDTRFFETSVERITTQPVRRGRKASRAGGIEIAIRFKNPGDARELEPTKSIGKDGMVYLVFELGPGGATPKAAASAGGDDPE